MIVNILSIYGALVSVRIVGWLSLVAGVLARKSPDLKVKLGGRRVTDANMVK